MKKVEVAVRPKRQITLPKDICDRLGIDAGDKLELEVKDSILVATPKKVLALQALDEIRQAFARSGITEKELLEEGRRQRTGLSRERYKA
jgi:AbrB family looped-hinge helix DNA binding protein